MKKRLTDLGVKRIRPKSKPFEVWDQGFGPGSFGVRILPSGVKSFTLIHTLNRRQKRVTLGRFPNLSVKQARQLAVEKVNALNQGIDPNTGSDAKTFGELASEYFERKLPLLKSEATRREYRRVIEKHFLPKWARWRVEDINRADAASVIDKIAVSGHGVMANRCHAYCQTVFTWGIEKGLCRNNPFAGLKFLEENPRERWLSPDEIRAVWKDLERRSEPTATILRIALLTGQRSAEVKQMEWSHFEEHDDYGLLWHIDRMATKKKKKGHTVPLSRQAEAFIRKLRPITGQSRFVFASPVKEDRPIMHLKKMVGRIRRDSGVDFTAHDFRRTATSHMQRIGVDGALTDRIRNVPRPEDKMLGVYGRWHYLPEMRMALQRWADELEQIVGSREPPSLVMVAGDFRSG